MLNEFGQDNLPTRNETEIDQLRELEAKLTRITKQVNNLTTRQPPVVESEIVPGLVNLSDNSDFIFSNESYNASTFADDEDVVAQWYARAQSTATSWVENSSGTESSESIRSSAHGSGARTGAEWETVTGSISLTGGYKLANRLAAKFASAGNYFAARMQVTNISPTVTVTEANVDDAGNLFNSASHPYANGTRLRAATTDTLPAPLNANTDYYVVNSATNTFQLSLTSGGAAINLTDNGTGDVTFTPQLTSNLKLKVSIYDNTDNIILTGTKPVLDVQKVGSHTGGTVTRQYILEIQMPDGRKFYSDISTFTNGQNQITNTVSRVNVDNDDYVTIAWTEIIGASRYRVYSRTPAEADTNWYLVTTITNGSTSSRDNGGIGGGDWTVPSFDGDNLEFPIAAAYYDDIGSILQTRNEINEVSLGLRVPSTFSPDGDQFLQIEFVKSTYANSDLSDICPDGIRIDRVGLSTTNGRWVPSARDLSRNATPITVNPPPSTGGIGGNPPGGTGENTCVGLDVPILIWSDDGKHTWLPAGEIVIGDKLVSWDGTKLAPTTVYRIISGISTVNNIIHTEENELLCSFSHRLITNFQDVEEGTCVKNLDNGDITLVYRDGQLVADIITSKEILYYAIKVRTFQLSRGRRNYIAAGFLGHNRKPFEEFLE